MFKAQSENQHKRQVYETQNNLTQNNIEQNNHVTECKICFENTESSWILDCGHLPFCETCSQKIFAEKVPKSPICRSRIKIRRRAFY